MITQEIVKNNRSGFDPKNIDKKKLKYVQFHEDTSLSKETLKIEKKLLAELNNILKYFLDNYIYVNGGIDTYNYRNVYEEFKIDMEIETLNIIKSYITKTYILATEYVSDSLSVSGFITKSDIDVIDELSKVFRDRFFIRIKNALELGVEKFYNSMTDIFMPASFNQTSTDINENGEHLNVLAKGIERSKSYIFSSLAILIINTTMNKATISKSKKIILNDGTLNKMPVFQAARFNPQEEFDPDAIVQEDFDIKQSNRVRTGNFFYIWKTEMDDRTCQFCENLQDEVFSILDSFIPEPENDTHFNCRCRLMLIYI